MSKKLLVVVIVIAALVSCNRVGKSSNQKKRLNTDEIAKVELISNSSDYYIPSEIKVLSKPEAKRFAELWNSSGDEGTCNFYPEYKIRVWLRNGEHREFCLTDKFIQENRDRCYAIDYKKLVRLIED